MIFAKNTPHNAGIAIYGDFKDFEKSMHLDNDTPGRLAAKTIKAILPSYYAVSDEPPKRGKDYNDYLKVVLGLRQQRERDLL